MNMKNDIDNQINELLKEDIEVPEIVNIKSEEAYNMLREINSSKTENSNNKKNKFRYIGIASAASFALLFGIGIYKPSLADGVPILHNVFVELNEKLNIGNKYTENNQVIMKSVSNNGVKVTINESIFDGTNLYLTMEVKSETDENLSRLERYVQDDGSYQYITYDTSLDLSFDGKLHNTNGIKGYFKDDKTFIGMSHYILENKKDIPESFDVSLNLGNLGDPDMEPEQFIQGPFKFNFKVNSTDKVNTIKPNASNGTYKVNEVKVSPFGLVLDYDMPCDYVNIKDGFGRVVVYDDKGNELGSQEYSLRDNDYKDAKKVIKEKLNIEFDTYENINGDDLEYILVKFEDGQNIVVDDTVYVSEDGSSTEGPSYKGVPFPSTKDIEFKIKIK